MQGIRFQLSSLWKFAPPMLFSKRAQLGQTIASKDSVQYALKESQFEGFTSYLYLCCEYPKFNQDSFYCFYQHDSKVVVSKVFAIVSSTIFSRLPRVIGQTSSKHLKSVSFRVSNWSFITKVVRSWLGRTLLSKIHCRRIPLCITVSLPAIARANSR